MTSVAVDSPPARERPRSTRTWYRDGARHALIAFSFVEVVALLWWFHVGRNQWFFSDDSSS